MLAGFTGMCTHRLGLPLTVRSCLFPLLGKIIYGSFGDCIDMLAVVTTHFAVVANMGVVATQMVAGLVYLEIVPEQAGIVGQVPSCPFFLPEIAIISVGFMLTL